MFAITISDITCHQLKVPRTKIFRWLSHYPKHFANNHKNNRFEQTKVSRIFCLIGFTLLLFITIYHNNYDVIPVTKIP